MSGKELCIYMAVAAFALVMLLCLDPDRDAQDEATSADRIRIVEHGR